MFIMFIRNASPYLIFHDLFIILFFMTTLCSSRSKDDLQPRKYFFLFTSYFVYMFSTLHLICVNLNITFKVELYNVKYIFLTYQYVNCRFIAEASWRIKR